MFVCNFLHFRHNARMPDVVHRYRALLADKENVCFCHNLAASNSGGDQDLPKGDRGERVRCEPKRGSGAEPPAGSRGRAPGRGQGTKPRWS